MKNKVIAILYFGIALVGGGYSLFEFLKFNSYSAEKDVWAIIITVLIMLAVLYAARIHWRLWPLNLNSKSENTLITFSFVNIGLVILAAQTSYTCRDFGCFKVAIMSVILAVTFITTLVLGFKINRQIKKVNRF